MRLTKRTHRKQDKSKTTTTQRGKETHKTMFSNIKSIVKKIGFTAAALALAAGLASAPAASASSLSSDSTSIVANVEDVSTGKLVVHVGTMSASLINPTAVVTVYNE